MSLDVKTYIDTFNRTLHNTSQASYAGVAATPVTQQPQQRKQATPIERPLKPLTLNGTPLTHIGQATTPDASRVGHHVTPLNPAVSAPVPRSAKQRTAVHSIESVLSDDGTRYPLLTPPGGCSVPYVICPMTKWFRPMDDRLFIVDRGTLRFALYRGARLPISKRVSLHTDFSELKGHLKAAWNTLGRIHGSPKD